MVQISRQVFIFFSLCLPTEIDVGNSGFESKQPEYKMSYKIQVIAPFTKGSRPQGEGGLPLASLTKPDWLLCGNPTVHCAVPTWGLLSCAGFLCFTTPLVMMVKIWGEKAERALTAWNSEISTTANTGARSILSSHCCGQRAETSRNMSCAVCDGSGDGSPHTDCSCTVTALSLHTMKMMW